MAMAQKKRLKRSEDLAKAATTAVVAMTQRRAEEDRPKKRQKDWKQVVEEAAAAASASIKIRSFEDSARRHSRLMEMAALNKAKLLTTKAWIGSAKIDPSKCIQMHDCAREMYKLGEEPEAEGEEERSTSHAVFLPFHLIFSRLPVNQLFQLRCVCKLWNEMLQGAPGGVVPNMETEQEEYWFVMSQPLPPHKRIWNFRALRSRDGACFRFPLPSHGKLSTLLGGKHCSLLSKLEHSSYVGRYQPRLVSAGGLMCAFVHKQDALDDYHVIVFNCLTGSVRVLPPLLNPHYLSRVPGSSAAVGCNMYMAVDGQDPARYYVMLTQLKVCMMADHSHYFEIFDSRRGSWRVGCSIESAVADSKVALGDFFFFEREGTLLAYHAADDLWSRVSVPRRILGAGFGVKPTFSKHKGRVLKAISLLSDDMVLGFVVWELHYLASAAFWVKVARTPEHLSLGLRYKHWGYVIRAEGSLFYMTFEDLLQQGRFRPPLVYDITQNLWYVLPGSRDFGCIAVHRPRRSMQMQNV